MALLQALADKCRTDYTQIRLLFANFKSNKKINYTPHKKWDALDEDGNYSSQSTWIKLVKFYQKHNFASRACIFAKFTQRIQDQSASIFKVMPNQFMSALDLDLYEAATAETEDEVKYQRSSEHSALISKIHQYRTWYLYSREDDSEPYDAKQIWTGALLSRDPDVSPLMRMCVVFSENMYNSHYEPIYLNAVIQYTDNYKLYDKHWGALLPNPIKQSRELLTDYLGK